MPNSNKRTVRERICAFFSKDSNCVGIWCAVVLGAVSLIFLAYVILNGFWCRPAAQRSADAQIMDRYDMYMTNEISSALEGVLSVEKVYWLTDSELVAPEPNQANFGESDDAASLQWLLDDAAELLDGQETLFTTETPVWSRSKVRYYLDETIFCGDLEAGDRRLCLHLL